MPSIFRSAAALAMVGASFANPMNKRNTPAADSCLAAVTGKAALGDDGLRKEHCSSFFKTIVTPGAITVTTTITDAPEPTSWSTWEKRDVTVCPNEVPNYASACDESGYRSACNAWGVSYETTFTIPATTTTKTIYLGGGKNGVCASTTVTVAASTTTKYVTVDKDGHFSSGYNGPSGTCAASTVTVTAGVTTTSAASTTTSSSSTTSSSTTSSTSAAATCLDSAKAKEFTDAFKDLLQFTNKGTTAANSPYHADVSAKYLAEDFKDYSDSINWMAHFPLGSVTFPSRAAFDAGQGYGQDPLIVRDVLTHFSCNTITWKWVATTGLGTQVTGINLFIINKDLTQITENHAEFNNGAWIDSFKVFGTQPAINCQTPQQAAAGNTTTTPTRRSL